MQHKKESTIKRMLSTMTNDGPGDFLQKQKKNKKKEKEKEKEKRTQKPNQRRRSENASRREHEMRPSRNLIGPAAANYDGPLSLSRTLAVHPSTSTTASDATWWPLSLSLSLSAGTRAVPWSAVYERVSDEDERGNCWTNQVSLFRFVSFCFVWFFFGGGGFVLKRPSGRSGKKKFNKQWNSYGKLGKTENIQVNLDKTKYTR